MIEPKDLVDAFVSKEVIQPIKCQTCQMSSAGDINKALIYFHQKKTSGETTQTWLDLHKYVIVPSYDYQLSVMSLRRHMKICLDLT